MRNLIFILSILLFSTAISQEIKIENLDINTKYDDFAPFITKNKKEFYYTVDSDNSKQVIYLSKSENMNWTNGEKLGGSINTGKQNGSVALTPDGQYMIFAAYEFDKNGFGRTDLYSARKVNGKWKEVENLGVAVNSEAWDSNPALTSDGNTLYFASDRAGGKGGADIYMSKRTREGWTKATPVSIFNTAADDLTPHIAYDDVTFTFSSNRAGGSGGFDIYFSKLVNGNFTQPQNPGSPINSAYDEYSYFIVPNTDIAYYSSNRPGGKGNLDLYRISPNPHLSDAIVNVYGSVTDFSTGDMLGANVVITDLNTGDEITVMRSDDEDGFFSVVLKPDGRYSITAEKPGYLFHSEEFAIKATDTGYDIRKDIQLTKTTEGATTLLVFFDFDKSTLKDESKPELNRLVRFMNTNPDINFIIEGHTDDRGAAEYNKKLSKDRANSVMKFLEENGISNTRMTALGKGMDEPLINEKTDQARAQNRRVELIIVK